MASAFLYGWDETGEEWVRVECNSDGKLHIDATLILEDSPTDGELLKAPTSNWAFDHDANADAHHAKYTDTESRLAINDLIDSAGVFAADLDINYNKIINVEQLHFLAGPTDTYRLEIVKSSGSSNFYFRCMLIGTGFVNSAFLMWNGSGYYEVVRKDTFQGILDDYLEDVPTDGVVNKAPTSNWAYDHENLSSVHHTKYTNADAQAAVNLDGDLFMSIGGIAFKALNPDTDQVHYNVDGTLIIDADDVSINTPIILPHGCTVTACLVDGNAGATSQTVSFFRVDNTTHGSALLAQVAVGTEDTSIVNAVIDNENYHYCINITLLDTADEIYYARIKYTL